MEVIQTNDFDQDRVSELNSCFSDESHCTQGFGDTRLRNPKGHPAGKEKLTILFKDH